LPGHLTFHTFSTGVEYSVECDIWGSEPVSEWAPFVPVGKVNYEGGLTAQLLAIYPTTCFDNIAG
jgi:hypothetical protein